MARKLYIEDGSEYAYELDWFIDEAKERNAQVFIELEKPDINGESMWCGEHGEFVTRGENECGKKQCPTYSPCNGKSGRCRNLKNTLIGTGKKYTVNPDGSILHR